jgi:hypothetical protein
MARLLIEDVTLIRGPEQVTAHIRFKGGASQTIHAPVRRSTDPQTVALAQRLLEDHHDHASIAALLNQAGIKTARGKVFTGNNVRHILHVYQLSSDARSGQPGLPMVDLPATGGAV